MAYSKVAISLSYKLLKRVDDLVSARYYSSRSQAIQEAIEEKLAKVDKIRLAAECLKLDIEEEQSISEEGIVVDGLEWPKY